MDLSTSFTIKKIWNPHSSMYLHVPCPTTPVLWNPHSSNPNMYLPCPTTPVLWNPHSTPTTMPYPTSPLKSFLFSNTIHPQSFQILLCVNYHSPSILPNPHMLQSWYILNPQESSYHAYTASTVHPQSFRILVNHHEDLGGLRWVRVKTRGVAEGLKIGRAHVWTPVT